MAAIYTAKLLKQEPIAQETLAFWFEKPPGFSFTAGQYVSLTLGNVEDPDPRRRTHLFSIASAPYEPELMVAMRMRESFFKEQLRGLPLGSPVTIRGPYGSFVLSTDETTPAIFLIGGIGITPVRSIVLEATQHHSTRRIILLYANSAPNNTPFLSDLQRAAAENPHFSFIPTMTDMDDQSPAWSGETGRIDRAMIERHLKKTDSASEFDFAIYYLVGPPSMVTAMRELLSTMSIPAQSIQTEEFTGY